MHLSLQERLVTWLHEQIDYAPPSDLGQRLTPVPPSVWSSESQHFGDHLTSVQISIRYVSSEELSDLLEPQDPQVQEYGHLYVPRGGW